MLRGNSASVCPPSLPCQITHPGNGPFLDVRACVRTAPERAQERISPVLLLRERFTLTRTSWPLTLQRRGYCSPACLCHKNVIKFANRWSGSFAAIETVWETAASFAKLETLSLRR